MFSEKIVKFEVSAELIAQALALPEGATIENIRLSDKSPDNLFTFFVTHDSFEPVTHEQEVPEKVPIITINEANLPRLFLEFKWEEKEGGPGGLGPVSTDYPEEIKIKGSDLVIQLDKNGQVIPRQEVK